MNEHTCIKEQGIFIFNECWGNHLYLTFVKRAVSVGVTMTLKLFDSQGKTLFTYVLNRLITTP